MSSTSPPAVVMYSNGMVEVLINVVELVMIVVFTVPEKIQNYVSSLVPAWTRVISKLLIQELEYELELEPSERA